MSKPIGSPPIKSPKDDQRMSSPSPSRRPVSQTRVNKERQPLLSARERDVYSSIRSRAEESPPTLGRDEPNHGFSSARFTQQDDVQSVVFHSSGVVDSNVADHLHGELPHPHQLDHLEWSEILPYYLPIASWIFKYDLSYFVGDLIGGLSLVFFQLPLSLSYASSLAHVPIVCGLLSLTIAPLIYMVFGSVPQMITGPEAAISLIVGQAVEPLIHHKKKLDPMDLVVVMTFISGATLLGFGLGRFGFLDNVLNGSLLKGFISGVGIIMAVGASVDMLGLTDALKHASETGDEIHTCFDKAKFVVSNLHHTHMLTFKISLVGLIAVISMRTFKKIISKTKSQYARKITYFPEILVTVAIATWLNSQFHWNEGGVQIVGRIKRDVDENGAILYNPLSPHRWPLFKAVGTSGFLCAMLGFFESTTALKSLGSTYDLPISSNRELVALGFINIIGSLFGALPAFGGYGRSKINAMSAKTTVLGAIMGLFALLTMLCLLDFLYYIPKCILSVVTATIGILLIEEAPYDIYFHWRARGYNELVTFFVTVLTTVFVSMEAGIAVGLIYLLIRVIKHSASSRIQILGRFPNTNHFVAADFVSDSLTTLDTTAEKQPSQTLNFFTDEFSRDLNKDVLEEVEGCLIIRIPEPLTFTNTNDLQARLRRLELYGSTRVHPATKRTRTQTQYVIFDFKGMSGLDSSAAQMLTTLLEGYRKRGIFSFFVRVHKDEKIRYRLKNTGLEKRLFNDLNILGYYSTNPFRPPSTTGSIGTATSDIYNLTEPNTPYFEHISDALKVIDHYENNLPTLSASAWLLDVDTADRRSSLPQNSLV